MFCPSCGHDNLPEARFCARCGGALAARQPAASVVAAPTPTLSPSPASSPSQPVATQLDYAYFWVRLGAWFIDLVIVLAVVLALAFWSSAMGIAKSGTPLDFTVGALLLASPWLYFWLFTGMRGQTLGKMAVGIHVVNAQGKVPGLGRVALREIVGKTISTIALFLGFLWIIWDPRKQGWHDMMASTYVVRRRRL